MNKYENVIVNVMTLMHFLLPIIRLFRGSATSSESRVCPQRHTTQLLTTLQRLSTRLLASFSRNSSQKPTWLNDKLGECLWAYRTTVRTSTKTTPFSLVYGCEAVLPLEIQIPSLCVALTTEMTNEEKHQLRLQELEALDDKTLASSTVNRALSSLNYQSLQQES